MYAHKKEVHQYITREAFKLLQKSLPNATSEMATYIGTNEVWNNPGVADGSFGALKIVSGAYIEDEYDVVYHYGLSNSPSIVNFPPWLEDAINKREFFSSITHFWNADGGQNSVTNLDDEASIPPLSVNWAINCENAYQKIQKYVNGNYTFLWAYNNSGVQWGSDIHTYTKFNIDGVIDFYKGENIFQAYSFFNENGQWESTDEPSFALSNTDFYKAHAYEICLFRPMFTVLHMQKQ